MGRRDIGQAHRAATPLELLVDLVFVVAVAQAVDQVVHAAESGHTVEGLVTFAMVFFAIWWAWMNFTWFASAYDSDDGPYRLLVMLQMAGVLVLAAGVDSAAEDKDLTVITLGYVIMRVALITQWLRAAASDPDGRPTAQRYALGIGLVQVGWLLRLLLPAALAIPSFIVLAAAELVVPQVAERVNRTGWHPHHIAERYGLFTLILLGESVLATVTAVRLGVGAHGFGWQLALVALCGLVVIFALWWLYFLDPMGHALEAKRELAFRWGYGHVGIFVALALLGAGLELTVAAAAAAGGTVEGSEGGEGVEAQVALDPVVVGYALAGPIALYLVMVWIMLSLARGQWRHGVLTGVGTLVVLGAPLITLVGGGIVTVCLTVTLATAGFTAVVVRDRHQRAGEHPALVGCSGE
jgi:low temperature requirement protein LtrA